MHESGFSASSEESPQDDQSWNMDPVSFMEQQSIREPVADVDHKKKIEFRIPSLQRRNVDKYIVRTTLSFCEKSAATVQEALSTNYALLEQYAQIQPALQTMQRQERIRNERARKDYAILINLFIRNPVLRIILKCCLESNLRLFQEGRQHRVKSNNIYIYQVTIEDILLYLHSYSSQAI